MSVAMNEVVRELLRERERERASSQVASVGNLFVAQMKHISFKVNLCVCRAIGS